MNRNEAARSFADVAILRPGRFVALDGRHIEFSAADLGLLAANYDPASQPATLNVDHRHSGPALGRIAALRFDGDYVRADLAGVPARLARAVDEGKYPFRSAEVYLDLDGRGPYLRGLALLGAKAPAVRRLPPMPVSTAETKQDVQYRRPLAAGPSPRSTGAVISIHSEVVMTTHANNDDAGRADPVLLAEENLRLAAENRQLRQTEQRRSVALFLAGLRTSGRLTPALESCGVEAALLAAEDSAAVVQQADGTEQALADVLRNVLAALPVTVQLGESEAAAGHRAPRLSDDELLIARQLGLTEQELREIKAAG